MMTAYSVSGNVVRLRILICATRQKLCRKIVYPHQTLVLTLSLSVTYKISVKRKRLTIQSAFFSQRVVDT